MEGMEPITLPINPIVIMQHPRKVLGFVEEMRGIFRTPELEGMEVQISSGHHKIETVSLMSLVLVIVRGVGELTIWVTKGFADHIRPHLHSLFGI